MVALLFCVFLRIYYEHESDCFDYFFRPKLEWVYGYRGRDARSNLYLLPTGEIVYFVAAVVVLFNAEEHSQRHYMGHTEDIRW